MTSILTLQENIMAYSLNRFGKEKWAALVVLVERVAVLVAPMAQADQTQAAAQAMDQAPAGVASGTVEPAVVQVPLRLPAVQVLLRLPMAAIRAHSPMLWTVPSTAD